MSENENNDKPKLDDETKKLLHVDGAEWLGLQDEKDIQCDNCGCRRSSVYRVDRITDARMRERICENCGHHFHTYERKKNT